MIIVIDFYICFPTNCEHFEGSAPVLFQHLKNTVDGQ